MIHSPNIVVPHAWLRGLTMPSCLLTALQETSYRVMLRHPWNLPDIPSATHMESIHSPGSTNSVEEYVLIRHVATGTLVCISRIFYRLHPSGIGVVDGT
jgi:hypothetical protein